MALNIPIPNSSYSEQEVSLSGVKYNFIFRYIGRDQRWRIDIFDNNKDPIIHGIKIMENQDLTGRYNLPSFSNGNLYCLRVKQDLTPVSRDNIGLGKAYNLLYFSNEEIDTLLAS